MHVAKRSENNRDTGVWIRAPTPHAYFKPRSKILTPGSYARSGLTYISL